PRPRRHDLVGAGRALDLPRAGAQRDAVFVLADRLRAAVAGPALPRRAPGRAPLRAGLACGGVGAAAGAVAPGAVAARRYSKSLATGMTSTSASPLTPSGSFSISLSAASSTSGFLGTLPCASFW